MYNSAEFGPSANPKSIRLARSVAKPAATMSGSMATDHRIARIARIARAQRRPSHRSRTPESNPPSDSIRKKTLPARPISEEDRPSSCASGWAMIPSTALSAKLTMYMSTSTPVSPQAVRRDSPASPRAESRLVVLGSATTKTPRW